MEPKLKPKRLNCLCCCRLFKYNVRSFHLFIKSGKSGKSGAIITNFTYPKRRLNMDSLVEVELVKLAESDRSDRCCCNGCCCSWCCCRPALLLLLLPVLLMRLEADLAASCLLCICSWLADAWWWFTRLADIWLGTNWWWLRWWLWMSFLLSCWRWCSPMPTPPTTCCLLETIAFDEDNESEETSELESELNEARSDRAKALLPVLFFSLGFCCFNLLNMSSCEPLLLLLLLFWLLILLFKLVKWRSLIMLLFFVTLLCWY